MSFQHSAFQHNAFQVGASGAAADAVVRRASFQQEKRPRQVIAGAVVNLLLTTLAVVAAPVVPEAFAGTPQYRWQTTDTSVGMAQVLQTVAPPVIVAPHTAPIKTKWLPEDTSSGVPKSLTQDAQLPFFVTQHTAPDRLRPVVNTSQKQPITLQVIVPPVPIANVPHYGPLRYPWLPADASKGIPKPLYQDSVVPFLNVPLTQHYRGQWATNDTSRSQPATLQIVVAGQPPVVNAPQLTAQFKGGRWSAQPIDTSSGTPVIIAFPPAVGPGPTYIYGVGFSGVSLPKKDSVRKVEQTSVSYKEEL